MRRADVATAIEEGERRGIIKRVGRAGLGGEGRGGHDNNKERQGLSVNRQDVRLDKDVEVSAPPDIKGDAQRTDPV